jgi:putative ABC transport system permease protein
MHSFRCTAHIRLPAERWWWKAPRSIASGDSGDEITIELNNDATRTLRVVGTIHDGQRFSPTLAGAATVYVTPETLESLGYPATQTEMLIRATDPAHDEAHILAALDQVEAQLEDSGRTVYSREVITESRADPFIDSVVLILTAFGLVILALSSFLVVNAMSALITQQVPQIGVMKLIGARRSQIMALYLATVLIYGLLAVLIALPLAALTARLLMTQVVEPLLNVRVLSYAIPARLLGAQAAIGLLLPLAAGIAPVIRGTRITTHQALNDVGIGGAAYGRSLVERLLDRVQRVRRIERRAPAVRIHSAAGPPGPDAHRAGVRHRAVSRSSACALRCDARLVHALPPLRCLLRWSIPTW